VGGPTTVIRVSYLPRWPDCNRRSAATIFRDIINAAGYTLRQLDRGIGASIGTSVHASAAAMLNEKAKSGSLPPESTVTDVAVETLKGDIANGVMYDGERGATRSRNEAEKQVTMMARKYRSHIAPTVDPILVEERLEAEVAPGLILSGQPDLVAREPKRLRDLKTGTMLSNFFAQLGGYSLLCRTPTAAHPEGIEIADAAVDFMKRVRADKPQPDPIVKPAPIAEAETAAINIVQHIDRSRRLFMEGDPEHGFVAGDPWAFQSNPNSTLCGDRYCACWGTPFCRDWMPKE